MSGQTYVYIVYIHAPAETIFAALTTNEVRPWWFDRQVVGDYRVGVTLTQYSNPEHSAVDLHSEVLELDPPRRLKTTFFLDGGQFPVTTVAYDLIPLKGGNVKLIVTHEGLNEALLAGVSKGWPAILSGLKTVLETGEELCLAREDEAMGQ